MDKFTGFKVIKTAKLRDGYSWTTAEIGKDSFGNYWIRSGSGCSCNYIGDEAWEPLKYMTNVKSALAKLYLENENLSMKADFIAFAQGLLRSR